MSVIGRACTLADAAGPGGSRNFSLGSAVTPPLHPKPLLDLKLFTIIIMRALPRAWLSVQGLRAAECAWQRLATCCARQTHAPRIFHALIAMA